MQVPPVKIGRQLLVIELDCERKVPPGWVRSTVTIPGREGTFTRVWASRSGAMDAESFLDMETSLHDLILTAFEAVGGIQGVLPFAQ